MSGRIPLPTCPCNSKLFMAALRGPSKFPYFCSWNPTASSVPGLCLSDTHLTHAKLILACAPYTRIHTNSFASVHNRTRPVFLI